VAIFGILLGVGDGVADKIASKGRISKIIHPERRELTLPHDW